MTSLWDHPWALRILGAAAVVALAALALALARSRARATPDTEAVENRRFLLFGMVRGAILVLSLALAGCLILVLAPETAIEKMTRVMRSTRAAEIPAPPVALLYLGDETKGTEFHIRGFVRNISPRPIESLDASIRLYAPDGSLLETTVARMDVASIPPDATAEFHLVYPDYSGRFTSYSVDFKLRSGEFLPYKDWRATRRLN
jgi:hypothetical protein